MPGACDPCRLARQVKRFRAKCSGELLHLPDKPAGVENSDASVLLAVELLHLLGKPAGVGAESPPAI
jgi:hypothetical protein